MSALATHFHALDELGPFGLAMVIVAGLFTGWVIWKAVIYTLHPGEEEPDHIKRSILDDPTEEGDAAHAPGPWVRGSLRNR